MNPSNFDDLTKALPNSTSRRQALRTILTASVGGLLGIGGISTAFGRHHRRRSKPTKPSGPPPGNSNCAKFCAAVYGPNTPAASACTSDGARNKGLCRDCGTKAPSSICCHRNGSGYCDGTAGACCSAGCHGCPTGQSCTTTGCCTNAGGNCNGDSDCCSGTCCSQLCCGSNQACVNNSCVPTCAVSEDCPTGQTCYLGFCLHTDQDPNGAEFYCTCQDGPRQDVCAPGACDVDLYVVCTAVCADHGGIIDVGCESGCPTP